MPERWGLLRLAFFEKAVISETWTSSGNAHNLCKPYFPSFVIDFIGWHKSRVILLFEYFLFLWEAWKTIIIVDTVV
jgi:hypothetical protein